MPIVSATDVPLQPFPTGRTSPQAPNAYQQIPTDASMFGSLEGKAQQEFGAGLEKLGTGLFEVGLAQRNLEDKTVTDDNRNKLQIFGNKRLFGDPDVPGDTGLYGKQGLDAVEAGKTFDRELQAEADRLGANMSDRQRMLFQRQAQQFRIGLMPQVGAHILRESREHAAGVQAATTDVELQNAHLNFNNPAKLQESFTRGEQSILAGLRLKFGNQVTPDMEQAALGVYRNKFVNTVTKRFLAENDPAGADAFFQSHRDLVTDPTIATSLEHDIKTKLDDRGAAGDASGVLRNNGLPGIPGAAPRAGARTGGEPLVPYTPATGVLEGIGLKGSQYDIYRRTTASEESKRYDEPPSANKFGYMGRYQMGGREVAAKRGSEDFNEIAKAAKRLGIPEPTTEEFLKNPALQERLFENYTLENHNELMRRVPQYRDADPAERAALLMGAHIGGVGGVERFLKSGGKDDPSDGHRSVGDYVRIMRQAQKSGGPNVAVIPHTPTPGTPGVYGAPGPQVATSGGTDAATGPAPVGEPPTLTPPGVTPAVAPAPGPPASPLMPLKTEDELIAELPTTDAAGNPLSEERQRKAANELRKRYRQHVASMRGEIANVTQLRKDDLASIEQTGKPIEQLTPVRIGAAQGQAEADEHAEQRKFAENFYNQTNDFDQLPTFEMNRRLEQMRKAGEGQPGFERFQRNYDKAVRKADHIRNLRIQDPATAVARFPDVVAASQGADLANPQTYQPLVKARMEAFATLGIPADAQVPMTREEATTLWRPIGAALRAGNERLARQEMEKTVRYLEEGWGGEHTKALGFVLAAGQANQRVSDMASAALKDLAKSHQPTPAQLRALEEAKVGRGIAEAFGRMAPPQFPSPTPPAGPYGGTQSFVPGGAWAPNQSAPDTPGGAYAPPTMGPPAPTYAVPVPAHITKLRQQPETAHQFDAVYGPGAAARVLGMAPALTPGP